DLGSDYPGLAASFAEVRLPILLMEDSVQAGKFADWHEEHASEHRAVSYNPNLSNSVITPFSLEKEFAATQKLATIGRVFCLDSKAAIHIRNTSPQRVYFLTFDLFRQWVGSPKQNDGCSFAILQLMLSYHREQLVCGKI